MIHRLVENANYARVTFFIFFSFVVLSSLTFVEKNEFKTSSTTARSIHVVIVGERTNEFDGKSREHE